MFGDANYIEIFYQPDDFPYGQTVTVSVAVVYGIDFPYWIFDAHSFIVMDELVVILFTDDELPDRQPRSNRTGEQTPNGLGQEIIILDLKNDARFLYGPHGEDISIEERHAVKSRV